MRTNLAIGVSASITFDFVDGACSEFCLDDDDCLGGSAAAHCVPFIPQRGLPDLSAIGLCMRACEDDNDCRDETQTCRPIAARVTYEDARAAVDVKNVCLPAAVCGDGANDGSEACDDGNDIDGDGCSAACAIEACDDDDFPSVFDGINFGDTGTSTSAHFESICAGINFGFPRHEVVSKYSAPSDGTVFARLLQFDRDDGGLILSVRRSCDAVFAEIGCVVSEVNGSPSQLAVPVSAGDVYFVVDDAFGGTVRDVVPGSYELDIRFVPSACGDGIRGEGETCDGADVGGATCPDQLAGSIGSMACDVVCELDVSGCALVDDANHDQEPNFPAPANSNPYVEPFLGTLDPNTDIDCVSIELAASSIITAHIDDLHEGVCFDMNSSAVNILDATRDSLVFALGCFDDARTSVVEPGTYFVCVGDAAFTAVPVDYRLTIRTALPVCGNGITEASEECDTLDIPETRCASRDDTTVGTLNCSDACTLTFDDCEPVAFTDTEPNTLTDAIPFTDPSLAASTTTISSTASPCLSPSPVLPSSSRSTTSTMAAATRSSRSTKRPSSSTTMASPHCSTSSNAGALAWRLPIPAPTQSASAMANRRSVTSLIPSRTFSASKSSCPAAVAASSMATRCATTATSRVVTAAPRPARARHVMRRAKPRSA